MINKVSVIIPVYNEGMYLKKCLDSVVKQTLSPIEIICIDDGSTDESLNIMKEYSARYPWIRLIRQCNQGAGAARNRGILAAEGLFLCFLDADDYYLAENALEVLFQTAVQEEVLICGGLRQVDHGTGKFEKDMVLRQYLGNKEKICLLYQQFQYDFDYQCYLYQKQFLTENNLLFPNLRRFQDPPFFIQAMFQAKEFVIADVEFYCYRAGHKNIHYTGQKADDLMEGMFFDLKFAYEHHLDKLLQITAGRINDAYFDVWYDALERGNTQARKKCTDGQKMAESYQAVLEPLAFYKLKSEKNIEIPILQKIKKKISKGSRVILYGAGDIGRKCYLFFRHTGFAELVLWVDKYRSGETYYDQVLYDMQKISDVSYDLIIITLKSKSVSKKVKQSLADMGVLEDKICEWADEGEEQ